MNKFINHEQYIYFNHLKFFILNQKQKSYSSKIETEGKFTFNPNVDIIDIQDVIKMVDSLPIEKMEQINLLKDRLSNSVQVLNCDRP